MTEKSPKKLKDEPWLGLKLIAAYRVKLPEEDVTDAILLDFAKWQICKSRNIMFRDPIWDDYTEEEVLIEFFGIMYDENEDLLTEFLSKIQEVDNTTLDWFERMETEHQAKMLADQEAGQDEFEETFDGT